MNKCKIFLKKTKISNNVKVMTTDKTGGMHLAYKAIMLAAPQGAPKRFANRITIAGCPTSGAVFYLCNKKKGSYRTFKSYKTTHTGGQTWDSFPAGKPARSSDSRTGLSFTPARFESLPIQTKKAHRTVCLCLADRVGFEPTSP